jgi:hypothetical protein
LALVLVLMMTPLRMPERMALLVTFVGELALALASSLMMASLLAPVVVF